MLLMLTMLYQTYNLVSVGGTVVQQLTRDPKFKGSNPTATGTGENTIIIMAGMGALYQQGSCRFSSFYAVMAPMALP